MDISDRIIELEKEYLSLDRKMVLRSKSICKIPTLQHRKGGKLSYAEWAHTIGLFQSLIFTHLPRRSGNLILDVGCGAGLLCMACEPYVQNQGLYIGLDVCKEDIEFCANHYRGKHFKFLQYEANNPFYNVQSPVKSSKWPFPHETFDMLTALSVWTHFNEQDALHYMSEATRVLKKGARAIITVFLLDSDYLQTLPDRKDAVSAYHGTNQLQWIFDNRAYDSYDWYSPQWAKPPEKAVAINEKGLQRLLQHSRLQLVAHHPGAWKELPGLFFQDVLVLQKS